MGVCSLEGEKGGGRDAMGGSRCGCMGGWCFSEVFVR